MIISCPSCETQFKVADGAIGPAGRSVRCTRCQFTWHQDPAESAPESAALPAGQDAPTDDSDYGSDVDAPPSPAIADQTVEDETGELGGQGAAKDTANDAAEDAGDGADPDLDDVPVFRRDFSADIAAAEDADRGSGWLGWIILLVIVVGFVTGVVMLRAPIVSLWPPATRLYDLADSYLGDEPAAKQPDVFKLKIENVTFEMLQESGRKVLVVRGEVLNIAKDAGELPPMRVTLRDEKGNRLFHWTVPLAKNNIQAGERVKFTTRLPNPPAAAQSLAVTFIVEN